MTTTELGIFAIVAYAVGFMAQLATPNTKEIDWRLFILVLNFVAIACHGLQLHWLIDLPQGQNLAWTNLLSLLAWLAAFIVFFASTVLPVRSLNLMIFPMSITMIGLGEIYHDSLVITTVGHPQALWHILLSTLIVAMLIISGIQACLVLLQQLCLSRKKLLSLLQLLPPLQIMQQLLFWEILMCFLGLTLLLVTSLASFGDQAAMQFWFKSILAFSLWVIFLGLVLARIFFKWRTHTAAIWTTAGVGLAVLIYLSNHVVLH